MREISYRCFTACGALSNPRLFTRQQTTPDGRPIKTIYLDVGDGPLFHPGPCMKGPPHV